jgi:DNA-binding LytR/AlgR family response regulator
MIRCLIVDDEPLARQLMGAHVQQIRELELAGTCETALEAFAWLHQQPVDLLFLDIQMPGIDGLSFLRSLKQPPKVIFTTAHAQHAVDAFDLDAIDYLLKPVTFERFLKAVQKVLPRNEAIQTPAIPNLPADDALFLKVNKRLLRIPHGDIYYLEALGDYLKLFTASQTHVAYLTLSKAEELLPPNVFVRIHKSYIINIRHIRYVEGNIVRILDQELPIGTTYRDQLLRSIQPAG